MTVGECAIRMAKAGAQLVGVNCLFDPPMLLEVIKDMKVISTKQFRPKRLEIKVRAGK